MKIHLIPKVYFLMLPAIFLAVLHTPYFLLPDMHIDLMLWYFYILFSNNAPSIISLLLFGLGKDLLTHDILFLSSLIYIVFCRLSLLCSSFIAPKTFLKVWLGYIVAFTIVYLLYFLIHSIIRQHILFSWMSILEVSLSLIAYPLMHYLFYLWRAGNN